MPVAQFHQLSHIEPKPAPRKKPAWRRAKTKRKGGRSPSPTPPVLRPPFPSAERSEGAIIHVGFSAKKVRTLFRNRHKFAKNAGSPEKGESTSQCGGRGGIPPQTPPAAPPASLLAFLGISDTKENGARGEKTRARSRRSRILTGFVIFHRKHKSQSSHSSKRPTSASAAVSGVPLAPTRMADPHRRALAYGQSATGVAFPYRS